MFRYRLHSPDGDDLGEATYAMMIKLRQRGGFANESGQDLPLTNLLFGTGRRFRVLDMVPFKEEDESPFVGLLKVEPG